MNSNHDDLRRFLAKASEGASSTATARVVSLDDLRTPARDEGHDPISLATLRGRLVELSALGASATLSTAFDLGREAQAAAPDGPVCWITSIESAFYPPDAVACGVDIAALVVVHVANAIAAARAAQRLLRSGAFELLVMDLVDAKASGAGGELPLAVQGRLVTLAQTHDVAVVCLTSKTDDAPSVGSLVSLRVAALRTQKPAASGSVVRVLKDKRRGPGLTTTLLRKADYE